MTGLLWIFFCLVLLGSLQSADSRCKTHICLTWTFKNAELALSCKLDSESNQDYKITFYHLRKRAFCVPSHHSADCRSLLASSAISQNNITRETVFKIHGNSLKTANGRWTCTFGENIVNSSTVVTIPDAVHRTNNSGIRCWQVRLMWTMCAFVAMLFIIRVIDEYKSISDIHCCIEKVVETAADLPKPLKTFLIFIGIFVLCVIPAVVGVHGEICKAQGSFLSFGVLMGIIIYPLLRTKGNCEEYAPTSTSEPCGHCQIESQQV